MRYFVLAICLTALIGTGWLIDTRSRTTTERVRPKPLGISTLIFASGKIEGISEAVQLRVQMNGRVIALYVREGDFVEAGTVLLELDSAEYQQQLVLAQAEHQAAQARLTRLTKGARVEERREAWAWLDAKQSDLDRALLSFARTERLFGQEASTPQEMDDARALVKTLTAQVAAAKAKVDLVESPPRAEDVAIAQAQVAAAKSQIELARIYVDRCRLRAPSSGRVMQLQAKLGSLTGPLNSGPAVVLADTSEFRVRAFVEELDAPQVKVGQLAQVTIDGLPGTVIEGKVSRLSPKMGAKLLVTDAPNEQFDVKVREVWIDLERCEGLVMGLRVDVVLER